MSNHPDVVPHPSADWVVDTGLRIQRESLSKCLKKMSECVSGPNKGYCTYCQLQAGHTGACTNVPPNPLFKLPDCAQCNEAPSRATTLPDEPAERKKYPIASGVFDYFPDALVDVARVSFEGNEQHNPGQPLHWSRGKSDDHADTMQRHFLQRGTRDKDKQRHAAKMVWRALAILQLEIEAERK